MTHEARPVKPVTDLEITLFKMAATQGLEAIQAWKVATNAMALARGGLEGQKALDELADMLIPKNSKDEDANSIRNAITHFFRNATMPVLKK